MCVCMCLPPLLRPAAPPHLLPFLHFLAGRHAGHLCCSPVTAYSMQDMTFMSLWVARLPTLRCRVW